MSIALSLQKKNLKDDNLSLNPGRLGYFFTPEGGQTHVIVLSLKFLSS
jgi:hypothetical protein